MTTTQTGRNAEQQVADLLKKRGHTIISLNWRNRWCEIDIVSKTKECVYFTEVKYRGSQDWGDGFSYITLKKMKQMTFAAEFWLHSNGWEKDCLLQGAAVNSSNEIEIIELS
jgi:uncharacterized protein (TIGR00252 family)